MPALLPSPRRLQGILWIFADCRFSRDKNRRRGCARYLGSPSRPQVRVSFKVLYITFKVICDLIENSGESSHDVAKLRCSVHTDAMIIAEVLFNVLVILG